MPFPKGGRQTEEARRNIAAGLRRAYANDPSLGERLGLERKTRRHSDETKRKIGDAHRRKIATDPDYRASRTKFAEIASRAAREKFLASLATTPLRLADIPLSKDDQKLVRSLPCAICRSRAKPRQLAHIVAKSQGGPELHVWGNVLPLCTNCHPEADHGGA